MGQAEGNRVVVKVEEQQILFVMLPRPLRYWLRTEFYLLIVLIIAIPVSLLNPIPPNGNHYFITTGIFFFLYNVFIFLSMSSQRGQDRKRVESIEDRTVNFTADESKEIAFIFERVFNEVKWEFAKEKLPNLKAIVDPLLQLEIQAIALRDELLELEPVQSSFPIKDRATNFFFILMIMACFRSFMDQSWFLAVLSLSFLLIIILPRISYYRDRFPHLRFEESLIFAGPGWVKHTKVNRTWTIADSIILLRLRKRKPLDTLYVRLLGPTKDLNFIFESVRDPEFIRLWQRWMHPNPRLELMNQDT